ncbi:MAG TPA: FAD-binding oxidoreductase [Acidimicrobiales bacterium]|nr:FAD-binding oxidoreductase [Acidimicrobiales bacterium]
MNGAGPYRRLSLWWDQVDGDIVPRPGLPGDLDVDVAIVGAGFTGLWTARSLLDADRSLRVAVLEQEVAGFGASGRNGGWCSALFAASDGRIAREHGEGAARAMRRAMQDSVDQVGRAAAADGIDCRFAKGGTVVAARSPAQVVRARREVAEAREHGVTEDDLRWLDAGEARSVLGAAGVLGATYTPHCAALQPALLARGLAGAVERRGGAVYEQTVVTAIEPGGPPGTGDGPVRRPPARRPTVRRPTVHTAGGRVRADVVVRAVEGWTPRLPGTGRAVAPVYSLMVATEPLGDRFWAEAGLADRQTFSDHRHLIVYGQRTADGRIAFGGRGAPYHFGSQVRPAYDRVPAVHRALRDTLVDLFPALAGVRITHTWGGPLGVPRDWFSSVGLDRATGMGWAGGYVGDGVSTANLAGRTLADLVLDRDSDLVRLPWVGHRSPSWEPEPLRWLGVNAGLASMKLADRTEGRRGRPSRLATAMGRLLGG